MEQTIWRWLVHPDLGAHRVPENPGVVQSFTERDWILTDLDGEFAADSPEVAAAVEQAHADNAKAEEEKSEAKSAAKSKKKDEE